MPLVFFLSFLFLALHTVPASGEEAGSSAAPVRIMAEEMSYDREKDLLEGRGNVEVHWDQYTLLSDSALVRQERNEAAAAGNVRLVKGTDYTLTADRIKVNYVNQMGEVENGRLYVKPRNFHLYGAHFTKTGKDDYTLKQGSFTTCDGDVPSWKFTATDLDITVDEYATGRNAIFYVKNIPLLYTPWIKFPVKVERQSGLLIPRFGSSTKRGLYLDVPYYFAISPSQDLTLDLDLQTKRGAGLGVNYRYLRPGGSGGTANGYLIYDTNKERERGYISAKGHEFVSPALTLTSDINLTLDRDFFRDYGEANGDYNRQLLRTSAFFTANSETSSLTGEMRYIHDLDAENNQNTLQQLPALNFFRSRTPIGRTPFYFGFGGDLINFYREAGIRGQRLDLRPEIAYYQSTPIGLDLSGWLGYRQRFYNGYGADAGRGVHGDGQVNGGAVISTSLARVYDSDRERLKAVRHTIVPELGYSFSIQNDQERLPFFDYNDRPLDQGMITWSVANYVTGKYADPDGASFYRDLLYLRLSQGYQGDGGRRDLLTPIDEGKQLTDLRTEIRYYPTQFITIDLDSRFNTYDAHVSTAAMGLMLDDRKGNRGGLGYRYARGDVNYLEGSGTVSRFQPFTFAYDFRYSLDGGAFLETHYSLEYRMQCWSIILAYRDRPDNREFAISLNLTGVGSIGPLRTL